jgi:type IV pilus assembly protein PilW
MKRQQGYSLISTMVGLTIGLLVAATAMGTVSFMEAQKRTTTGGNSAVVNGAMGLTRIENEVKLSGLGLMSKQSFACPSFNLSYKGNVLLDGAPLYPLTIVDGDTASDTVTVAYLNTLTGASFASVTQPMADSDVPVKLSNAPDAVVGALMLMQSVVASDPCTIRQVTGRGATTPVGTEFQHQGGDYNVGGFATPVAYAENSRVSTSQDFVWSTFRVQNGTLEELNNITGKSTVVADGVVAMKAEYGITDGTNGGVASWVPATEGYATPTFADMLKVRAVRVGLAIRSLEKDASCPTTGSVLSLWDEGPTFDVKDIPDWRCYRYRTFNLMVPLVNVSLGVK